MNRRLSVHLLITLVAAALYIPFLGMVHLFDWDEINFAEAAREMIVTHNWSYLQIGFEPFWEKPPLFIWLQALSMKAFGINEFAARLPVALTGIVSLNLFYYFGRRIIGHFAGLFWMFAYGCSLAPSLYHHSGIIDPLFNLFIFLSLHQWFLAEESRINRELPRIHYLLSGIFAGLAFITKGPVSLLILGLVALVRIFFNRKFAWPGFSGVLIFLLPCLAISSVWVLPEYIRHGPSVLQQFWQYQLTLFQGQIEWHNQPWFYHIPVLLLLCFPASVFALPHLFNGSLFNGRDKLYASYMRQSFWVVLILFSIVSTKIIHYSSFCWIPLGFFGGFTLYRRHTNRGPIPGWLFIPIVLIVLVTGLLAVAIPLAFMFPVSDWAHLFIPNSSSNIWLKSGEGLFQFEWVIGAGLLLAFFIWLYKYLQNPKINATGLLVIYLVFSTLCWIFLIPKTEKILQGNFISAIEKTADKNQYTETWGFKSYAVYFYGNQPQELFSGPWEKETEKFSRYPNPRGQSRLIWLMDRICDKPVYIFTRHNFEPDYYFNEKFEKSEIAGAYILWKRKDIRKPDIRLNP